MNSHQLHNGRMSRLSFFLNYLSDPRIATLAATPQTVVKKVCRGIDFSKDMIVVEYGPGYGAYTRYLLNTMTRKSRLIAIETNKRFKVQLKKIDDRRLTVANDDARNVLRILRQNGLERVSYVISGIRFSLMNRQAIQSIILDTSEALESGGKLLVYQFSSCVKKYLKRYFNNVSMRLELGLPYYYVFEAWNSY